MKYYIIGLSILFSLLFVQCDKPNKRIPMLICSACERLIPTLNEELIAKQHKPALSSKEVLEKVTQGCFHSIRFKEELLRDACITLIEESGKKIAKAYIVRLNPKAEEFGEDVNTKEFCSEEVKACTRGVKSIDEMLKETNMKPPKEEPAKGEAPKKTEL